MAHDTTTRQRLRAKYVQGLNLKAASLACKVPYGTARAWKRQAEEDGDNWDLARQARRMTKGGVAEIANRVLEGLADEFVTTIDTLKKDKDMKPEARARVLVALMDGYNKAISASTRALPDANRLAVAMDVVRFITGLIARKHPKLRQAFIEAMEASGPDLAREFGGGGA